MPGRLIPHVNGEFYHLFNRGSDKRDIFLQPRDYIRLRLTFYYYQFLGPKPKFSNFAKFKLKTFKPPTETKLIEIICYCLMSNHFHFLVRQLKDNGISIFMSQLSNSYTKYFNTKYKRIGPLLQGAYKSIRVESDEQLIHLSRYIHLNPIVSQISKNLESYQWSSYHEYMLEKGMLCSTKEILGFFASKVEYKKFLEDQINYGQTLELIKHHRVDE
ncbi:transposase [Candidatus Gottesmanbacteria bacterium]|nr:transposase [Candidatus Gottesmanbacteria bacterium]